MAEALSLVQPITKADAERLSNRIGLRLDAIVESWEGTKALIREALEREAFRPLGYASPGAYLQDRFGGALAMLGIEQRRELVHEWTAEGISTRAIAPVFDVSQKTIVKDKQVIPGVSPEENIASDDPLAEFVADPQELAEIHAMTDGVTGDQFDLAIDAARSEGDLSRASVIAKLTDRTSNVTGVDGKVYQVPQGKKRRRSLPDQFRNCVRDLRKSVERVERLVADDRFRPNRAGLAEFNSYAIGDVESRVHEIAKALGDSAEVPTE